MNRINFLIAIHSHQPVGNFDHVFQEAFDQAYSPFFEILKSHPRIKVALHYSGCLFDWFTEHKPEFLKKLKSLVKKRQVELIGGGYYEPILPLITDADKLGQLEMLTSYIKKNFGADPLGSWTAERVWEQSLAKPLCEAGIKYTIVDDTHFKYAGLAPERAMGYYATEEQGKELFIFPGSKKLRYLIPFKDPQETINYLKELSATGDACGITYADDGEKLGLWPGTYKWVYKENWLERFFQALEANSDFINTMHFSEYIKQYPPTGRIYLPCASYEEMMEWSGGYFRNFLVKYPESNNMHKKMMYVSAKARKAKNAQALRHLYMGQCNCGYWHGVFGGLYLNHLRNAIYNNLIESEKIIDEASLKNTSAKAQTFDFDMDGENELLLEGGKLNLYFDPNDGGSLFELDYKPLSVNLTNVIARREEAYHKKIREKIQRQTTVTQGPESIHDMVLAKEEGLGKYLVYDRYKRNSFRDHFLREDVSAENFSKNQYEELGNFATSRYAASVKKETAAISAVFKIQSEVRTGEFKNTYALTKTIKAQDNKATIKVSYQIQNKGVVSLPVRFGTELNLSLRDDALDKTGEIRSAKKFHIKDVFFNMRIGFAFRQPTDIFYFPIQTVSASEEGFERTYQGFCIFFHRLLNIAPKQTAEFGFQIDIK
ncbi:MAG: alpha-amylase/4-alpha-glucanotransferase domain-containing protein [Candidatus Omnitrophota bacterium]